VTHCTIDDGDDDDDDDGDGCQYLTVLTIDGRHVCTLILLKRFTAERY